MHHINVDGVSVKVEVKQIERGLIEISGVYRGINIIASNEDYQTAVEKWCQSAMNAPEQDIFKR